MHMSNDHVHHRLCYPFLIFDYVIVLFISNVKMRVLIILWRLCEAVYVNIRSALLRRKFVFLILGTRILTRKAYCPSAKIRFRYTQFLRDSLIPFSQLDILWMFSAIFDNFVHRVTIEIIPAIIIIIPILIYFYHVIPNEIIVSFSLYIW